MSGLNLAKKCILAEYCTQNAAVIAGQRRGFLSSLSRQGKSRI